MRTFRYDEIDSTNEQAFRAIVEESALDGDVHVARVQTQGRGRRGRAWVSPAGEGLYLSYIHLPKPPPPRPEAVTVAAGLALLDAVRAAGAVGARLKWPNDLVCDEAKLAGILVESRGLQAGAPHYVVGMGLNVLQESFPEALEAERSVTSLARLGIASSCAGMEEGLLERLPSRLAEARRDPLALFDEFLDAAGLRAGALELVTGDGTWRGVAAWVGAAFELELRLADGTRRRFPLAHIQSLSALSEGRRE